MENIKASFDTTTPQGKIKVYNSQNGASHSLKHMDNGQTFEVEDALQYQDEVSSYGEKQTSTISVLYGTDGETYAGISDSVAKAVEGLFDILSDESFDKVTVKLVKQESNSGREFLNLQIVD